MAEGFDITEVFDHDRADAKFDIDLKFDCDAPTYVDLGKLAWN